MYPLYTFPPPPRRHGALDIHSRGTPIRIGHIAIIQSTPAPSPISERVGHMLHFPRPTHTVLHIT